MGFKVDDIVTPKQPVKGLKMGEAYTVERVNEGVDGAYDFDEIYIKGKYLGQYGWVCEFLLEKV